MTRFLLIPVVLGLAACSDLSVPDFRNTGTATAPAAAAPVEAVPTPTVQLSDKDRLLTAIEANGCVITAGNVGAILTQASINAEQLASLTMELETDGLLSPDGTDTVRLSSSNCI